MSLPGLLLLSGLLAAAEEKAVPPLLKIKMKGLDGKDLDLSKFQGKVLLIVNVASECGHTPQYKAMQALHDKYGKDGLVVLGVPCNDFGAQEPGNEAQIAKFCQTTYGVKFPLTAKVAIAGKEPAPLYKFLMDKETNPKFGGPVTWNFTKFLVGKNGTVVARFEPDVEPDAPELVKALAAELAKK